MTRAPTGGDFPRIILFQKNLVGGADLIGLSENDDVQIGPGVCCAEDGGEGADLVAYAARGGDAVCAEEKDASFVCCCDGGGVCVEGYLEFLV